ncbi:MAG: hypothetical protein KJ941_02530 [Bacteroidetes bacterium]|nr:hypothetical protein [Bacteroidota bacterium]
MKGKLNRISIALVTVIYCLAMALVSHSAAASNHSSYASNEQEKFQENFSVKLLSQPSQTVNSSFQINNLPNPSFKSPLVILWRLESSSDELTKSTFTQYSFFTKNLRINRRKTDLIFPFHHFF